jgi:hypothetical protein
MRALRMLTVVVLAVLAGLAVPDPARAGAWAVTILDPLPDDMKPGVPYTVGMWVLQHGSHPFEGALGQVSLTLESSGGVKATYPAVSLIEAAHYAVAIVGPPAGTYKVVSAQGIFQAFDVGTLRVPGGFTQRPVPPPMAWEGAEKAWPGPVRPPTAPVDQNRDPFSSADYVPPAVKAPAAAPVVAQTPATPPGSRTPLVVSAAVVVAGLALLLTYRRRGGQRSGPSPSSSSMTWIAASSALAPPPSMPASQATESASSSSPDPSSSSTSRPARGSVS